MENLEIDNIITQYNLAKNSYVDLLFQFGVKDIYFYGITPPFRKNAHFLRKIRKQNVFHTMEGIGSDLFEPFYLYALGRKLNAHIEIDLELYEESLLKVKSKSNNSNVNRRIGEIEKFIKKKHTFYIPTINYSAQTLNYTDNEFEEFVKYIIGEKTFCEYKLSICKLCLLSTVDQINKQVCEIEKRIDDFIEVKKKESKSLGITFFCSKDSL